MNVIFIHIHYERIIRVIRCGRYERCARYARTLTRNRFSLCVDVVLHSVTKNIRVFPTKINSTNEKTVPMPPDIDTVSIVSDDTLRQCDLNTF